MHICPLERATTTGPKIGSEEVNKCEGDQEDEATNEQENESKQSTTENKEKEIAKQSITQNTQLQEKKMKQKN